MHGVHVAGLYPGVSPVFVQMISGHIGQLSRRIVGGWVLMGVDRNVKKMKTKVPILSEKTCFLL